MDDFKEILDTSSNDDDVLKNLIANLIALYSCVDNNKDSSCAFFTETKINDDLYGLKLCKNHEINFPI